MATTDFSIGQVSDPDFVQLPDPAAMFAKRANRLRVLAEDHPLGPFLKFLAGIVDVQQAAVAALPPVALPPADRLAQRLEHGMPPLAADSLCEGSGFADTLAFVAGRAGLADAPDAAEQARVRLLLLPAPARLTLAEDLLAGSYHVEQLAETLYVAAALQVHLARLAARLDPSRLKPVGDGVCPACGGGAVASMIVASRARYCCCALCGTLWNHVRIKCTACAATVGIAYYAIEGGSQDSTVETCKTCQTYIKHLHQQRNAAIDFLADDLATFALDSLARDSGFRRATPNPFLAVP
jgi:FdhE protein